MHICCASLLFGVIYPTIDVATSLDNLHQSHLMSRKPIKSLAMQQLEKIHKSWIVMTMEYYGISTGLQINFRVCASSINSMQYKHSKSITEDEVIHLRLISTTYLCCEECRSTFVCKFLLYYIA